ncbi:hypothetical protein NYE67_03635 [Solibacillus sp. FSL W8-0474]|uniref:hypothetical protein n=1 Tax=Solibacillus sp. FSL W8-0474 TaxID=2975336 RepID=UPI0030F4D437
MAELSSNTGGKSIDFSNANWGNELSAVLGGSIGGTAGTIIEEEKMATLLLQVDAVGGQTMKIELFDARSHKLGVDDLQLDPYTEAQKASTRASSGMTAMLAQANQLTSFI